MRRIPVILAALLAFSSISASQAADMPVQPAPQPITGDPGAGLYVGGIVVAGFLGFVAYEMLKKDKKSTVLPPPVSP